MSGEVKIIKNKAGNIVKITTDKDGNRVAKEYKNKKLIKQTVFHKEQELNWAGEITSKIVSAFKDLGDIQSTTGTSKTQAEIQKIQDNNYTTTRDQLKQISIFTD